MSPYPLSPARRLRSLLLGTVTLLVCLPATAQAATPYDLMFLGGVRISAIQPDVNITYPVDGAFINTTTPDITWTVTGEPGHTFTSQCETTISVSPSVACSSPFATSYSEGTGSFSVQASDDTTSDLSPVATTTFTVDTTAPGVSGFTTATTSPTNAASVSYTLTFDEPVSGLSSGDFSFSGGASGWTVSAVTPDNATKTTYNSVDYYSTYTITVSGGNDGTMKPTLDSAKVSDRAGNSGPASAAAGPQLTMDATAPAAPVLGGTPTDGDTVSNTTASITISGEGGATFSCSVNGGAYASCTSPKTLSGLSDGSYSLAVKQTDAAGNTSPAATVAWTVDTTPPAAPSLNSGATTPADGASTNSTSASVAWTGEAGASFTCSVDGGAYASCTSPKSLSGLADGAHSLAVKQTDAAGNTSPALTHAWTVDTVKPATLVLSGAPTGTTGATSASISWSGGEAGASFSCSVDGGAYASCTSPKSLSGLSDGAHSLAVTQTDVAGNTSDPATASWTVDTTPPPPPTLGATPAANLSSPSISWTGQAGATFTCSVDVGAYASCTSPKSLGPLSDGPHSFDVKQSNGFVSSAAASVSWTVDTTPPAAPSLDSGATTPSAGAFTQATSASVAWTGEAGASFTCSVDGGAYASCTSPKSLSGLADGAHSLAVKQTDSAGNTSPALTHAWTVDTAAPAAPSLSGAPTGTTGNTVATVSFTGEAGASFTCSVDGGAYASCTSPKSLSGLGDGAHSLAVKQTDQAGNTSPAATASWTVDTTIPVSPALTSQPSDPTNSTSASFAFTGDPGATFQCKLDGGAYASCTSPKSLSGLSDGAHTFSVTQSDGVNTSSPATYTWTVDTAAPVAPSLTGTPASPTGSTSANIAIGGEAGATFTCSVDGGAYASCTSPHTRSGLSDGSYSLSVKQTDAAGNTSPATTVSWTVLTATPPAPTLGGSPADGATVNATTASITITGQAGATFTCSVDGSAYTSCTSPKSLSGLANGAHSLAVKQSNGVNESPAATVAWTVDTTPPAAPSLDSGATTPSAGAFTQATSASVAWTGEAGASFTCSVDGGAYASCTSPKSLSGLSDGAHSLAVKQTDAAGNTSPALTHAWTVDTAAPAAPSLSGAPTGTTGATSASISFTGEAGATFTCSVDGGAYASCTSPKSLSGLTNGAHSLAVKQTDQAGNTSPAATASWTVDTSPPPAPTLGATPAANLSSPSISWTGQAGATFTCSVDGGAYASCTSPKSLGPLSDGPHSFAVKQDNGFATSPAATVSWTVDTFVPAAPSLNSGATTPSAGAFTQATSASVAWTGEAGATFTCSVDGGAYASCTSPKSLSGLSDGAHSLAVKQTDAAGNTSPALTHAWTVDTVKPATLVLSGTPTSPTSATDATISWTGEANATFTCSVDGGAYASCTSPKSLSGLADGAHSLAVKQTDQAGNTSDPATASWTVNGNIPQVASFSAATPTNATPVTFTLTFQAGVKGLDASDFNVTGSGWTVATVDHTGTPTTVGGVDYYTTWTVQAAHNTNPPAEGTLMLTLKKDSVQDADGQSGPGPQPADSNTVTIDTTAPAVPTLDNAPSGFTKITGVGQAVANVGFTSEAGATFQCKLDSAAWSSCTSPKPLTGLSEGAHTLQVKAVDAAGNESAAASASWTVDVTAPPTPTLAGITDNSFTQATSASITWSAVTDPNTPPANPVGYLCADDGGSFSACSSTYTRSGLSDGAHSVAVKSVDAAGNESAAATLSWTVDTVKPAVSSFVPVTESPTVETSVEYTLTTSEVVTDLDASDLSTNLAAGTWTVDSVTATDAAVSYNGKNYHKVYRVLLSTTAPVSGQLIPTLAADKGADRAGNTGPAAAVAGDAIKISPAPRITGLSVTPAALRGPRSDLSASMTLANPVAAPAEWKSFEWASCPTSSPAPTSLAAVYTTCTKIGGSTGSDSENLTWPDPAPVVVGPETATKTPRFTLTLPAVDRIAVVGLASNDPGSATAKRSRCWGSAVPGRTNICDADFLVINRDRVKQVAFRCKLDAAASWSTCTSPYAPSGLSDGAHTLYTQSTTDGGANWVSAPATAFTVGEAPPAKPTVNATPKNPNAPSTTPSFALSSTTTGAVFRCRVDAGSWISPCASPYRPTGLANGAHILDVQAAKDAGASTGWSASTSIGFTWGTPDVTKPSKPAITAKPDATSELTTASFEFTGEDGSTFECQLDGAAIKADNLTVVTSSGWSECTSPLALKNLDAGPHSFRVRQTDPSGNTSDPESYSWTISDQPPSGPVSYRVAASSRVKVDGNKVAINCQVTNTKLQACHAELVSYTRSGKRIWARTVLTTDKKSDNTKLTLTLSSRAQKLLATHAGPWRVRLNVRVFPVRAAARWSTRFMTLMPPRQVVLPSSNMFVSGSAWPTDGAYRAVRNLAASIRNHARVIICVGHTDSVGPTAYNKQLGLARARTICRMLKNAGVRARFITSSAGESQPRASNRTVRGRTLNRRVVVTIKY